MPDSRPPRPFKDSAGICVVGGKVQGCLDYMGALVCEMLDYRGMVVCRDPAERIRPGGPGRVRRAGEFDNSEESIAIFPGVPKFP